MTASWTDAWDEVAAPLVTTTAASPENSARIVVHDAPTSPPPHSSLSDALEALRREHARQSTLQLVVTLVLFAVLMGYVERLQTQVRRLGEAPRSW